MFPIIVLAVALGVGGGLLVAYFLSYVSAYFRRALYGDPGHESQTWTWRGRDPTGKTEDDLRRESYERIEKFLRRHGYDYVSEKEFDIEGQTVTAPYYILDDEIAVFLDDWHDEYLVSSTGVSTVLIGLYDTDQYTALRRALGIEEDWRDEIYFEDDDEISDLRVLGLEPDTQGSQSQDSDGDSDSDMDITADEVREAYRERIKETHPDLNDSDDADEEFMRVQEAYESLMEEREAEP
ncbi:MAG: DnaJ domain-containing protein [Halobacteria archaeon]|nr:DnaJ domain-containing protein [Halobacteria archaeon]